MEERDRDALNETATNTLGGCAMGVSMLATIAAMLLFKLIAIYVIGAWTGLVPVP